MTLQHDNLSPTLLAWAEQGRVVNPNGMDIFVTEHGPRQAPTLLFIHGFPTSSHDWRHPVALLAADYHCVALDLPGFGLSDKPIAYSYSLFQQADTVEAVAAALDLADVHVISHDMGTSLHTELLARKHRGTLTFTLASSTFLNGSILKTHAQLTEFQKMLETPSRIPEAVQVCAQMLPDYVPGLKQIMTRPDRISDDDAQVMTELMAYRGGNARLPNAYGYVRERYLHQQRWLEALIHESETAPVQLVWAIDDPVAVIAMGRSLAEMAPNACYTEVPDSGHFLPFENPQAVAAAVTAFVPISH
ncbi:alpha/beta fold hydrolase [Nocardia stercoris]|uniref:Alpha/beta hydrolase n=1 Tax=Nocardia stercoris TaxID=2483361 RepID=A0A3M2KVE1_9NOCA|nr:alpha/beta hydrolase [Nocardia stercoris]RMI28183.1 alpha/beta hydrolase [Nocardia stercoris]